MVTTLNRADKGYIESLRLFNGMIKNRPEKVYVCRNTEDIVSAINYSRTQSKIISVLGSGHNVSGRATMGDVVISVRNMKRIEVLPSEQIAICEPGVTMSIFDLGTLRHGLVCTGGTVSSTGITGLTLGGGIGWLHGNLGASSDNVIEFELIDYRSRRIICSEKDNPDLFWVMRGAGFGIGVVTKISYGLHKLRIFAGYNCLIGYHMFSEVKDFYLKITKAASKRLTVFLSFLSGQDGEKRISIEIAFSNFEDADLEEFRLLIEKVRREFHEEIMTERIFDDYVEFQSFFDNEKKYGMRSYWKSLIKRELENHDWELIQTELDKIPSKNSSLFIERYHGKMSQLPSEHSAFSNRNECYGILITSTWLDGKMDQANIEWTKRLYAGLTSDNDERYINYLSEPRLNVVELTKIFGKEKLQKIIAINREYDPNNLFVKAIQSLPRLHA